MNIRTCAPAERLTAECKDASAIAPWTKHQAKTLCSSQRRRASWCCVTSEVWYSGVRRRLTARRYHKRWLSLVSSCVVFSLSAFVLPLCITLTEAIKLSIYSVTYSNWFPRLNCRFLCTSRWRGTRYAEDESWTPSFSRNASSALSLESTCRIPVLSCSRIPNIISPIYFWKSTFYP